jgi:hypothetical protein
MTFRIIFLAPGVRWAYSAGRRRPAHGRPGEGAGEREERADWWRSEAEYRGGCTLVDVEVEVDVKSSPLRGASLSVTGVELPSRHTAAEMSMLLSSLRMV